MYSNNFIEHMHTKTSDLIAIENEKKQRAINKLNTNLKMMLDHIPKQLKQMKVQTFLEEYHGNLDIAAQKLIPQNSIQNQQNIDSAKMYMSPPKMGPKKRSIKIAGKFKKNDIN